VPEKGRNFFACFAPCFRYRGSRHVELGQLRELLQVDEARDAATDAMREYSRIWKPMTKIVFSSSLGRVEHNGRPLGARRRREGPTTIPTR
jgi:hypothetical protein